MDPVESTKRLEMHVKRVSRVQVTEEPTPDGARANMASPDTQYVGSMVGEEDGFPTGVGMRRRVLEAPLGSKIGYHELDDEKEEADEDWMTGEASQLSGAGTRGSSNWALKILLPISLIVAIIILHNWWTEVKQHASNAIRNAGDIFDRRLTLQAEEEQEAARPVEGEGAPPEGRVAGGSRGSGREGGVTGEREGARQGHQQQGVGLPDKAVYSVSLGDGGDNNNNEDTKA